MLWASAADADRLGRARSAVYLVGSYDGSGNFGDVLQFASALSSVREMPGAPLPVAVVERETMAHHLHLVERYPSLLGGAVFTYFDSSPSSVDDGLVELSGRMGPTTAALYVYGGGFLNWRWGARKVEHAGAVQAIAGAPLATIVSGQQVDEDTVAPGGWAHELLVAAESVGVRDALSAERVREHVTGAGGPVPVLAGDDAVPFLPSGAVAAEGGDTVNFHINHSEWISENPGEMRLRIARLLCRLGEAAPGALRLRPLIAYEDPRVSERAAVAQFLDVHGEELLAAGVEPLPPLDLLADVTENAGGVFRAGRLTVSRSYHVTLASLAAGIPAVLVAENEYYDQKAAGLRDLFGLDHQLVGSVASSEQIDAAAATLVDGPERDLVKGSLKAGADSLRERHGSARAEVIEGLADALRSAGGIRGRFRRRRAAVRRLVPRRRSS